MPPNPAWPLDGSLAARLAYLGYDAVGCCAALLCLPALPLLRWRGRDRHLAERLGRLPAAVRDLPARPVWIHAASVGETLAAGPLVAQVRRRRPELPIVMSATTASGRAVACEDVRPEVATLLPVDALRIVDRAFGAVRPRCLVLVETEIWPGLLRAAHRVGAPIVMVSGRLSARSLLGYRWLGPLFRPALAAVARFGMQTEADAARILALGVPAARVQVTGSLKAGRIPPAVAAAAPLAGLEGRLVLIAASTQPREEQFVLDACAPFWQAYPDLLLLIAPRRPERFDAVEALLRQARVRYRRRSTMNGSVPNETQVVLLDTLGELTRFLPLARAVFVGGTVAPLGGHNLLEPAAYGKAVAFGPHTQNVAEAARELCRAGGGQVVQQPEELAAAWAELLARPHAAAQMGARARAVAEAKADVIERTWALLEPYLAGAP